MVSPNLIGGRSAYEILATRSKHLTEVSEIDFPKEWLLRAALAEFLRYSYDSESADVQPELITSAYVNLKKLAESNDWIDSKLVDFLKVLRNIVFTVEVAPRCTTTKVRLGNRAIQLVECSRQSGLPIQVGNSASKSLPILELNVGSPGSCTGIVNAFADRIAFHQRESGANHLVFIDKQMGHTGAITMLSGLVERTGLPACVYREGRWARRSALGGQCPDAGGRIVVVHDLYASGQSMSSAADLLKDKTGAITVAAVALCGIGRVKNKLMTAAGQQIKLSVLKWNPAEDGTIDEQLANGGGEALDSLALRDPLSEESAMVDRKSDEIEAVPPGAYTIGDLPKNTEALKLLEDIFRIADEKRSNNRVTNALSKDGGIKRDRIMGIKVGKEQIKGLS